MCIFEQKVLDGISRCCVLSTDAVSNLRIGAAVSGGADSVSLLISLSRIFSHVDVITVNHNIRAENESGGDAKFVFDLCQKLGNCCCKIVEIKRGIVGKTADERGQGIEDAARFLRYEAFEKFVIENQLDYLCLAHNKNDQLETVLMRVLTGASVEASAGISAVRGKYIRPLLEIERSEIEQYLNDVGQSWRTDSTNSDPSYLRNKIRLQLTPFLNKSFPGWQTAILSGAQKAGEDARVLVQAVENVEILEMEGGAVGIRLGEFQTLLPAVQSRVLLKACSKVSNEARIPSAFLLDFCKNPRNVYFQSVEFCVKNDVILVKKRDKTHTETVFSVIIETKGIYEFPFGFLDVLDAENSEKNEACVMLKFNDECVLSNVELPVCVRSAVLDDEIKTADGKLKKICDIYSDWHVPSEKKSLIPIVQKLSGKNQEILCIVGAVYGFNNWIVL